MSTTIVNATTHHAPKGNKFNGEASACNARGHATLSLGTSPLLVVAGTHNVSTSSMATNNSSSPSTTMKTTTIILGPKKTTSSIVVHAWLEAMRASSPPCYRPPSTNTNANNNTNTCISTTITTETRTTTTNNNTCKMMHNMKDPSMFVNIVSPQHHTILPSALDNFDKIVANASGKRIVVFLDYDGTLSPIIENPDMAFMTDEMRAIVKEVAKVFPTAIISGRSQEKIREFVKLRELYYAGSHGMDIMGPKEPHCHAINKASKQVFFQPGNEFMLPINEVFKILENKTKVIQGAKVEHNKFSVTVHFRCVNEKNWVALAEQVHEVVQSYPTLRLTEGRKILEIRPLITWNKGKALEYLLKAMGFEDQNNVFPIYVGDDRTDEDAFKVVNRRKNGLSVLVSNTPKETNAICSVRDPDEVAQLLVRLVKWKKRRLNQFP